MARKAGGDGLDAAGELAQTSQASYATVEILVVKVETRCGLVGIGEGLARYGATGYATLVDQVLVPRLLGRDACNRRFL